MNKIQNYIHGNLVGNSDNELPVFDPSTGEAISNVVLSNEKDFNEAIESSKKSQLEWANTTPLRRSRIKNMSTIVAPSPTRVVPHENFAK